MTTSSNNPPKPVQTPAKGSGDVLVASPAEAGAASGFSHAITRKLKASNTIWIFGVLVVLVVAFAIAAPGRFGTVSNFRNIFLDAASLTLLAIGQTYVIITAGIDLSIGSVLVFSGVIGAKAMSALGGSSTSGWGIIIAGLVASLASGAAWGLLNGFLVAWAKIPPLIATLGTLGAALGFADIITNGVDLTGVPTKLNSSIGAGLIAGVPWMVVIVAVITVVAGLVLAYTRYGRFTYAVGSNAEGARRAGISVRRHLIKVYAMTGLLAGLAGFLNLARFTTTTVGGHTADNLLAIAAVVIGGTSLFGGIGTILGTVIGVFIPAVLANGFVIVGLQPYWEAVAVATVLVVAVYIDQLRRAARQRG